MINGIKKGTIVSTTEDRLTLLNWLKKLEKTLSDDTLTDIAFTDDGGNVSLVLTFEDGTTKSVAFPYDMSALATKEDLNLEYSANDFLGYFDEDESSNQNVRTMNQKTKIPNGIYKIESSSIQKKTLSLNFNQFYIISVSALLYDGDYISSMENFYTEKTCYIDLNTNIDTQYIFIAFGNIIYVDCFSVI